MIKQALSLVLTWPKIVRYYAIEFLLEWNLKEKNMH